MNRIIPVAIGLAVLPSVGQAQELGTLLDGAPLGETAVQIIALVTVLSLAPGILVTLTCFPFVVTVLAILRQAIGLQQSPPNMLLISLALFITYFVMEPVFQRAWAEGISPYVAGQISVVTGIERAFSPVADFMQERTSDATLGQMAALREGVDTAAPPASVLIPSFLLSELSNAFRIGFLVFLPFLIIDLVVSAVLMAMGMMMVPPAIVSLPFKLAFFVVADGWSLVAQGLVRGYLGG